MFYRRNRTYNIPLGRFSDWNNYQEIEADLQCKKLIESLGLNISGWTTASWVGRKGLFYNFSPEVLDGLVERMEDAKARKVENTEKTDLTASAVSSSLSS